MTLGLTARQNRDHWSPDMDATLMEAMAEELSFAAAARIVGVTKDQAKHRFYRLAQRLGAGA